MKKYYDQSNNRLVFVNEAATPEYWDKQWETESLKKNVLSGAHERFVYPHTKKFLPSGSRILEAGCGKGHFVYSLHQRNYEAYGIDFAPKTIQQLQEIFPEIHFTLGDVRSLPYEEAFFDGYWSLGVIEHFFDGYDQIANEMSRVLKNGGYAFITFPHMSFLRKWKAHHGYYELFNTEKIDPVHFYQFALDEKTVIKHLKNLGFSLVYKQPLEGLKGAKDEITGLPGNVFHSLYKNKSFLGQCLSYVLARVLAPFSSHSILLVFRYEKN